jgi:hypothetical protein
MRRSRIRWSAWFGSSRGLLRADVSLIVRLAFNLSLPRGQSVREYLPFSHSVYHLKAARESMLKNGCQLMIGHVLENRAR